jgi:putative ABC transport system permease protein
MVLCNVLLVALLSLQFGSYDMMINNSLGAVTGHYQVQHGEYLDQQNIRQVVPDAAALTAALAAIPGVAGAAARGEAFALAAGDERSFGIRVTGVQPARELAVSSLPGLVTRGRYLDDENAAEVVIGARLAENLHVDIGEELVLLGSGRDGSVAAGVTTVVGILESGMTDVDRGLAAVPLGWFDETFAMRGAAHRIVLRLDTLDDLERLQPALQAQLPAGSELALLDWDTLLPGLKQAIKSDLLSAWFMYAVLIALVALSVLNTQLMSVLERTREFGVMLALGLSPGRLARLVGMETCLLGLLGLSLGVALGVALSWYLSVVGFSYPGMEEMSERFNLPGRIYPEVSLLSSLWGPVTVFLGVLLAAIYPALQLFRLQPIAAMRAA